MTETWAVGGGGIHGTKDWPVSTPLDPYIVTTSDLDIEIRDRFDYIYGMFAGSALKDYDINAVQSPPAAASGFLVKIRGSLTEAASGVHPLMAGLNVQTPTIVNAAATVTAAASLYVQGAPSGAVSNYSVFVDAGIARFDDRVMIGSGTVGAPGLGFMSDPTGNTGFYFVADDVMAAVTGGVERMRWNAAGAVFVGGHNTDSGLTKGISIDQGNSDDAILTGRSSDVSHGITDYAESSVWIKVLKAVPADGGTRIEGYSDNEIGINLAATVTNDVATKATGSNAPIQLAARKKNTTGVQDIDLGDIIVGIYNGSSGIFFLDSDGAIHSWHGLTYSTIVDFDEYDDFSMINTFQSAMSGIDRLPAAFHQYLKYNKDDLKAAGIISGEEDKGFFVDWKRLFMLLVGSVRQEGLRLRQLESQVYELKTMLNPPGVYNV